VSTHQKLFWVSNCQLAQPLEHFLESYVTSEDLYEYLLSPEGLSAARQALITRYPLFRHVTTFTAIESIRMHGLQPKWPGGTPPKIVRDIVGDDAQHILCVHPIGAFEVFTAKDPPRCKLAVSGNDLPERIGLDWSNAGCWDLARIIYEDDPRKNPSDAFAEVATRRGSVVAYDGIRASVLRVCPASAPHSAASVWPLLQDLSNDEIAQF
jgi:hypothetical protein